MSWWIFVCRRIYPENGSSGPCYLNKWCLSATKLTPLDSNPPSLSYRRRSMIEDTIGGPPTYRWGRPTPYFHQTLCHQMWILHRPLKGPCLVLVIEWQLRWTNMWLCEIHRRLVHMWWCHEGCVMAWHRRTEATVKSKWGQDRWTNTATWWYEVDHIIWLLVGACVASTSMEMEWNAQGKGITYRAFLFYRS
jgi:hypothetical protein